MTGHCTHHMGTEGQPCPWDSRHIVTEGEAAPPQHADGHRGEVAGGVDAPEAAPRNIATGVVGLSAPVASPAGSASTPATLAPTSLGRGITPDQRPTMTPTLPLTPVTLDVTGRVPGSSFDSGSTGQARGQATPAPTFAGSPTLPLSLPGVSADREAAAVPSPPCVHSRQVTDTTHDAHARQTYSVADAGRRLVLAALADYGPMTDFDLAARISRHLGRTVKQTSVGKRRGELRDMGLVEDTHRKGRSDTDSPCIVWALTVDGEREARSLAVAS